MLLKVFGIREERSLADDVVFRVEIVLLVSRKVGFKQQVSIRRINRAWRPMIARVTDVEPGAEKSSLKLVGDRFALTERQRLD